jgi:hypothetical protein
MRRALARRICNSSQWDPQIDRQIRKRRMVTGLQGLTLRRSRPSDTHFVQAITGWLRSSYIQWRTIDARASDNGASKVIGCCKAMGSSRAVICCSGIGSCRDMGCCKPIGRCRRGGGQPGNGVNFLVSWEIVFRYRQVAGCDLVYP